MQADVQFLDIIQTIKRFVSNQNYPFHTTYNWRDWSDEITINKNSVSFRPVFSGPTYKQTRIYISWQEFKVMDSPPRPSAYEAPSSVLSSEATEVSALPPPEYSVCSCHSNCERSCVEYIPSGSGTIQSLIPDPLDGSESVLSSADQSITVMSGSSTRSTCAAHPLSTQVEFGCEDLDFRGSSMSNSPPPPYAIDMITSGPRPLMIMSLPPPEYSVCSCNSNCERPCLKYIPSGSETIQSLIPDPLDDSGSVLSSADQSTAIMSGASTRSTCATHLLSTCEVEQGCEPLDFRRSSMSDSPPPRYAIDIITSRPRPSMITSLDVTSRPGNVVSTVPSTPSAAPSNNHSLMSGVHRLNANRISQPRPRNTSVEQPGGTNSDDTGHRGELKIDRWDCPREYDIIFSLLLFLIFFFIFALLEKRSSIF